MNYGSDAGRPVYLGQVSWQQSKLRRGVYSLQVGCHGEIHSQAGFIFIDAIQWKIPVPNRSQANLPFLQPNDLPISGPIGLEYIQTILRNPHAGWSCGFTGEGGTPNASERRRTFYTADGF